MPAAADIDVAVVGAGFGGIGCAMGLSERGFRPVVFEALKYPGGCASTFRRAGHSFEAGATLFSGLDAQGLFGKWKQRYGLRFETRFLDPVLTLRWGGEALAVSADRNAFVESLKQRSGSAGEAVGRFFAFQRKHADALWGLFESPELLPPWSVSSLLQLAKKSPKYLPLLRLVGQPLSRVLERFGIAQAEPLRSFLTALCQITVQCSPEEAEAPFALAAIDYPWRGTGHVVGGIGQLASALTDYLGARGSEVRFAERIRSIRRDHDGFVLQSTRGMYRARVVVLNVLPQQAAALLGTQEIDARTSEVITGWGACMLYRTVRAPVNAGDAPLHLELVDDRAAPFVEGNHVFVSISAAGEPGKPPAPLRAMTVSTHVRPGAGPDGVQRIQDRMRRTLALRAPEWNEVVDEFTASPRTFERFTLRTEGFVGGIPRRAGFQNYRTLWPSELAPDVWWVGDSVFPGQSVLATAIGGLRTSESIVRRQTTQ